MDLLLLEFLKKFAEGKVRQTRCQDPFMWNKFLEYLNEEIKKQKG